MRAFALTVVIGLAAASGGYAQLVAPVTDNFDAAAGGGFELAGWTTTSSGTAFWAADALPAGPVGPGPDGPTFGGSAGSLNFNDDTAYYDLDTGSALSPIIDVTGLGGSVVLSFACNYESETTSYIFDLRNINIVNASGGPGGPNLGTLTLSTASATTLICPAMGTYHTHTVDISAIVGVATAIQVRFNFSADSSVDGFAGWFVDNFTVTCGDAIPPTLPTLLAPADGSCGSLPIVFDWTDSTDTTPCGPGSIAAYEWQIDTAAGFPAPTTFSVAGSTLTLLAPPGTFYWRVRAIDLSGNPSAWTPGQSFTAETALAPLAADTLFVNETVYGAQSGDAGFVDPVIDESPVFSAIFRDANCGGNALSCRYQVSDDPTFTTLLFDSGAVPLSVPLPIGSRSPDLGINISLNRDNVYYWRIQFTDEASLTGPFSAAQSFRIGDDWEFGVRPGSSNHSRRCWVATAAWGGVTPEVASLMQFRSSVIESSAAGRSFSRAYAAAGPSLAARAPRAGVRAGLTPLSAAAGLPGLTGVLAIAGLAALVALALRRL